MSLSPAISATRAKRAIGAMFFSAFGGAWLAFWACSEFPAQPAALLAIGACTLTLFALAWRVHRSNAPAQGETSESPEERRKGKLFHYINTAQWVAILVIANVLSNIGLRDFVLPAAILVIGLHFLPLARLFAYPPHFLTGAALMALAIAYPLFAASGPKSSVGALGAGLILWCSAAWAIRPARL